jgi:hypothetical protein
MSRVYRREAETVPPRVARRAHRECKRPPTAPTGLVGEFDRAEGGRGGHRIRARLRWNEVTTDLSGFPVRLSRYDVEVEYSANGVDWFQRSRHRVSAKDDTDPGTKAHLILRGLRGRLSYRWRVRAVARDGCRSGWSDWLHMGQPTPETPPAPANVRIVAKDRHDRVRVEWDEVADDQDQLRRRDDQSWFVVEIATQPTFGTIYRRVRKVHGTHVSIRVDPGQVYYARVRAVNDGEDHNWYSAWIPATTGGNSDPLATPSGVAVGKDPRIPTGVALSFDRSEQARHDRWAVTVTWNELSDDPQEESASRYVVRLQVSTDGTEGGIIATHKRVVEAKDSDADTTAAVRFRAIRTRLYYRASVRAVDRFGSRGPWSAWTPWARPSAGAPAAPMNVTAIQSPRRVGLRWRTPLGSDGLPDESISHYHVQVSRNSAFTDIVDEAEYVVSGSHRYAVPSDDLGKTHYVRVRPVSSDGAFGAWLPGPGGMAVTPGTDPGPGPGGINDLAQFAAEIRPVAIVSSLPPLPDSRYPVGSHVYLTVDSSLYENRGNVWRRVVDASNLTGQVTASQIAANAVTADKIAANAVTAGKIAAGAVGATQIAVSELSAISANVGTLTSGVIQGVTIRTVGGSTYVALRDADAGDRIKFVSSAGSVSLVAGGGAITLTGGPLVFGVSDLDPNGFVHLGNLGGDPATPSGGVRLYAKAGRLYYRSANGTVYGPL